MSEEPEKRPGIWGLSDEERWELAQSLLARSDARVVAREAFRRAYPTAPDKMIDTAVFHVYGDGPEAVTDWLADAELFLRDPEHRLCSGVTWHLLHHVYNWMQFETLMPHGKPGLLELLSELKESAAEGSLEAVQQTVDELEKLLEGNLVVPDFDFP